MSCTIPRQADVLHDDAVLVRADAEERAQHGGGRQMHRPDAER
jgi:hypothetical protein